MAPKLIFIVPYRDRELQKSFFMKHMSYVLEDTPKDTYEIYFAHQRDGREFNRGAMKNIGFLAMREKYPHEYRNITFVFNDVDTMPYEKNFLNYETTAGTIKHFYGFSYTLGGIFSIKGGDFEQVGGFTMPFSRGFEDNAMQQRVLAAGMKIDRSQFYNLYDKNILSLRDGITRPVNQEDFNRYIKKTKEGLTTLRDVNYSMENEFIQIKGFETGYVNTTANKQYDLLRGNQPFKMPSKNPKADNMGFGVMHATKRASNAKMGMSI